MKRYRIRRGTDQAWLSYVQGPGTHRYFWTDLPECAIVTYSKEFAYVEAELASKWGHIHRDSDCIVEEVPTP